MNLSILCVVLKEIAFALWFFIPVGAANVAPILAAAVPGLHSYDWPMDFRKSYRGKRIFGNHKTWRGLISGMLVATAILWLQQYLARHYGWAHTVSSEIDYQDLPFLLLGPAFALGALGGDAIESFFKRQYGIASGETWLPFDQLDYIIGGIIASLIFVRLSVVEYAWIIIIWFGMHLLFSWGGWLVGLKDKPI